MDRPRPRSGRQSQGPLWGGGRPAWGLSGPGPSAPHPEQLLRWGAGSPRRAAHWPHQPQGCLLPTSQTKGPTGTETGSCVRGRPAWPALLSGSRAGAGEPMGPLHTRCQRSREASPGSVPAVPGTLCDSRQEAGQRASGSLPRAWGPQPGRPPRPTLCPCGQTGREPPDSWATTTAPGPRTQGCPQAGACPGRDQAERAKSP